MPVEKNSITDVLSCLSQASRALSRGELVAIPTETVYGLAASINSASALSEIFEVKERPFFDPLIVHIAHKNQVHQLTDNWTDIDECLADAFWPGPLTIVCKKIAQVSPLISAGLETVAIRVPAHPFARRIINKLNCPIAAPSANMFGRVSPTKAEHVKHEFPNANFIIVDGGACQIGIESTVLGIEEDQLCIYRPGAISASAIEHALQDAGLSISIVNKTSVVSPGHNPHHYQPQTPLVVIKDSELPLNDKNLNLIREKLSLKNTEHQTIELSDSARIAARILYAELRHCDALKPDFILLAMAANTQDEMWLAVWDRIKRAASLII